MRLAVLSVVAPCALLLPRPASAQSPPPPQVELEEPSPRQGHFISAGAYGIGAMGWDESRGTRDPTFGQGFTLRLGESITRWLSLSLTAGFGFTYGAKRDKLSLIRFGVSTQWYFTERWSFQAAFGATNGQGPDPQEHAKNRSRYGAFALAGVGYDFYLSNNARSGGWLVTPVVAVDVGPASKLTTSSVWVGVELSYWTGLSRDKLRLSTPNAYSR